MSNIPFMRGPSLVQDDEIQFSVPEATPPAEVAALRVPAVLSAYEFKPAVADGLIQLSRMAGAARLEGESGTLQSMSSC